MIKKLIEDAVVGKPISDRDLGAFIAEYSELCGIKDTTKSYIDAAIALVKNGNFNIFHAFEEYIRMKDLFVAERLIDKDGRLLLIKLKEKNEKL